MLIALDDFVIDNITEIINKNYKSVHLPDDLTRSIYVALPMKPNENEYELHWTIGLMSHIIKIIN